MCVSIGNQSPWQRREREREREDKFRTTFENKLRGDGEGVGGRRIFFLLSQPGCPMKYERVSELPKNRILTCVIMVDHTHGSHVKRERGRETKNVREAESEIDRDRKRKYERT